MKIIIISFVLLLTFETMVIPTRTGSDDMYGGIDIKSEKPPADLISLDPLKSELDRWMTASAIEGGIPSAVVAMAANGEIVYSGSYMSSLHRQYPVASFTKTFVALSVLILQERGLVDIDAPVSRYLPVHLENDALGGGPVTVRHLLTHSSGLSSGGNVRIFDLDPPLAVPLQTCPAGMRFAYSNPGYNILGRLVSGVSGIPVGIYIRINILEPLDMKETVAPDTMPGASGIISTAADLLKYGTMLARRGRNGDKILVREETFTEIFRPAIELPRSVYEEYRGIGWRVWSVKGIPVSLNHASLWDGSGGWMQIFPDSGIVYVFMSDPPVYDGEPFYHFYRGMKYRLLRMSSLIARGDFNPERFVPDPPSARDYENYRGLYHNPQNGEKWEIRYEGGILYASGQGEVRRLVPFSRTNFVYIFPGQTEKGIAYDFVYRGDCVLALTLSSGFFVKEEMK